MVPSHEVADLADAQRRIAGRAADIRALGIRRLAIFGSLARHTATATSDVDILVEFAPGTKCYDRLLDLADLLEQALGRHVDLVTSEGLSPHVGPHILSEARDVLRVA